MSKNKKSNNNHHGTRNVELYGEIANPRYIKNHMTQCPICAEYDPELRREIDRLIAEEAKYEEIRELCECWGEVLQRKTLSSHKAYHKYLCDEEIIDDLLTELDKCGDMKRKYLTHCEQDLIKMYGQVQILKNQELLDLWRSIPEMRKAMFQKVYENGEITLQPSPQLVDVVTAYDILLKDALLLEGKPTGRLAVEQTTKDRDGKVLKGVDKLFDMLGVEGIVETTDTNTNNTKDDK